MTERVTVNACADDDGPHMPSMMDEDAVTYAQAGVDTARGRARRRSHQGRSCTTRTVPRWWATSAASAALFSIAAAKDWTIPVVSGNRRRGHEAQGGQMAGKHDTVGIDLVAMCATTSWHRRRAAVLPRLRGHGKLKAENVAEIVAGIGEGCKQAGCALIGGEMPSIPASWTRTTTTCPASAWAVVDRAKMLDPAAVREGRCADRPGVQRPALQRLLAGAQGVRGGQDPLRVAHRREELGGRSLQDALLEPHAHLTLKPVRAVLEACEGAVHALAHITGGGISENLDRALPKSCAAEVDLGTWPVPAIASFSVRRGAPRDEAEALKTFNMGLGMVLIVERGARRRGGGRADAGRRDHVTASAASWRARARSATRTTASCTASVRRRKGMTEPLKNRRAAERQRHEFASHHRCGGRGAARGDRARGCRRAPMRSASERAHRAGIPVTVLNRDVYADPVEADKRIAETLRYAHASTW